MSHLAFSAAPFENENKNNNENEKDVIASKRANQTHNKTIKNKKIESMKQQLQFEGMEDNDDDVVQLTDFKSVNTQAESGSGSPDKESFVASYKDYNKSQTADYNDSNLNTLAADEYYQHVVPSFKQDLNKEFIGKLDYLIHLLEEQREMKTGSVTEEIILYSFLGIFIIFVLDSFARAGKYTR